MLSHWLGASHLKCDLGVNMVMDSEHSSWGHQSETLLAVEDVRGAFWGSPPLPLTPNYMTFTLKYPEFATMSYSFKSCIDSKLPLFLLFTCISFLILPIPSTLTHVLHGLLSSYFYNLPRKPSSLLKSQQVSSLLSKPFIFPGKEIAYINL